MAQLPLLNLQPENAAKPTQELSRAPSAERGKDTESKGFSRVLKERVEERSDSAAESELESRRESRAAQGETARASDETGGKVLPQEADASPAESAFIAAELPELLMQPISLTGPVGNTPDALRLAAMPVTPDQQRQSAQLPPHMLAGLSHTDNGDQEVDLMPALLHKLPAQVALETTGTTLERAALELGRELTIGERAASSPRMQIQLPDMSGSQPLSAPTSTLTSAAVGTTPATAMPSLDIPLRQQGWDQGIGQRVIWMVSNKLQQAQIQLNPRELGPIEVRIQVQNDQAQVSFTAQHANVREALEAALPRLREMFESNGLNLAGADVSQQSFAERQQASAGDGQLTSRGAEADEEAQAGVLAESMVERRGEGLLDLFA